MIEASARGAWDDLASRLRPFVARRIPSPADADDVLQEVLLRMHRGLDGLADGERFGAWVYQIARNAIADHLRRPVRQVLTADGEVPELCADTPEDELALETEVAEYLTTLLPLLPAAHREAMVLVEIEGVSQIDAAHRLGISVSGMKSRVQRGRAKLRELLEERCRVAVDARGRVVGCEPTPCAGARPGCCGSV
jgi:RNA polymerase sigma-70 factor (ECF subfamily)